MITDDDFIHLPELCLKFGDLKRILKNTYNIDAMSTHNYAELAKSNVWGLEEQDIRTIEEEGFFDGGGHWVFNNIDGSYEAVYDGNYMHVFGSLEDLMARENEVAYYEYSSELSEEKGEETFVNDKGEIRKYRNGGNINDTDFTKLSDLELINLLKGTKGREMTKLAIEEVKRRNPVKKKDGGGIDDEKVYEVSLYYKDEPEKIIEGYLIKEGQDPGEDDDDIFYYVESENELKSLMDPKGVSDFVITHYELVNEYRNGGSVISADDLYSKIQENAGSYCMDEPKDRMRFIAWLKENCPKFGLDCKKAISIINKTKSLCTDNDEDMGWLIYKAFGLETKEYKEAVAEGYYDENGFAANGKKIKTFKDLEREIVSKYGSKPLTPGSGEPFHEAKFARKVLRDYGFNKNWRYIEVPNTQKSWLGNAYSPSKDIALLIIADDPNSNDIGMYVYESAAPIDANKAKIIIDFAEANINDGELHIFTTNDYGDVNDDVFPSFNTHPKINIRKHWYNDYAKDGKKIEEKIKVSFYKWGEYVEDEEIDLIDLPEVLLNYDQLLGFTIREEDEGKFFYASDLDIDEDDDGTAVKRAYAVDKKYEPKYSNGGGVRFAAQGMFLEGEFEEIVKKTQDYLAKYPYIWSKKGKNYVPIEGWQYAAAMMGLSARVIDAKPIAEKNGWIAQAEVVNQQGVVVCSGFGFVGRDEKKWEKATESDLESFAQTKAVSRALRNCISYLIKAAGYSTTPAEEMYGINDAPKGKSKPVKSKDDEPFIFDRPEYAFPEESKSVFTRSTQPPIVKAGQTTEGENRTLLKEIYYNAVGANMVLVSQDYMEKVSEALLDRNKDEDDIMHLIQKAYNWAMDNNYVIKSKIFMNKIRAAIK